MFEERLAARNAAKSRKKAKKVQPVLVEVAVAPSSPAILGRNLPVTQKEKNQREVVQLNARAMEIASEEAGGDVTHNADLGIAFRKAKYEKYQEESRREREGAKQDLIDDVNHEYYMKKKKKLEAEDGPPEIELKKEEVAHTDITADAGGSGCLSCTLCANPMCALIGVFIVLTLIILIVIENSCQKAGNSIFTSSASRNCMR
jgi:hypothetical protein